MPIVDCMEQMGKETVSIKIPKHIFEDKYFKEKLLNIVAEIEYRNYLAYNNRIKLNNKNKKGGLKTKHGRTKTNSRRICKNI